MHGLSGLNMSTQPMLLSSVGHTFYHFIYTFKFPIIIIKYNFKHIHRYLFDDMLNNNDYSVFVFSFSLLFLFPCRALD